MKIYGIGTDIIRTNRIKKFIKKEFLERLFSTEEIKKCKKTKKFKLFCEKICHKEAFLKH